MREKIKLAIKNIAFILNNWRYKLVSQCTEIQLRDIQIYDVSRKFMLSADDFGPQQDPKSQRTSHLCM